MSPRKWNPDKQPLGVLSDSEIARRLSIDHTTVRAERVKRGIPAAHIAQRAVAARLERCLLLLREEANSEGASAIVDRICSRIEREVLNG